MSYCHICHAMWHSTYDCQHEPVPEAELRTESPATERARHPEGKAFDKYFTRLLLCHTGSCFERDVLRDCKEFLWLAWKQRAKEFDAVEQSHEP